MYVFLQCSYCYSCTQHTRFILFILYLGNLFVVIDILEHARMSFAMSICFDPPAPQSSQSRLLSKHHMFTRESSTAADFLRALMLLTCRRNCPIVHGSPEYDTTIDPPFQNDRFSGENRLEQRPKAPMSPPVHVWVV